MRMSNQIDGRLHMMIVARFLLEAHINIGRLDERGRHVLRYQNYTKPIMYQEKARALQIDDITIL